MISKEIAMHAKTIGGHCLRSCRGLAALLLSLALLVSGPAAAERHALLIGVGDYGGPGVDLEGPPSDVRALYSVLRERWGFRKEHMSVLLDGGGPVAELGVQAGAASKEGILEALAALQRTTRPGDHIFIYFSGHGTGAKDLRNGWPLPYDTAALVPWGFRANGRSRSELVNELVVGRTDDPDDRDIRSLLLALDDPDPARSRQIFIAVDACYSARAMRSLGGKTRSLPLPAAFMDEPELAGYDTMIAPPRDDYPYANAVIVTASAEHQQALDLSGATLRRYPTLDGEPHGALTDTLLRILIGSSPAIESDGDGRVSYGELFDTLRGLMAGRGFPHDPSYFPLQEQGGGALRTRALFSGASDGDGPSRPGDAIVPQVPLPAASPLDAGPLRLAVQGDDPALAQALGALAGIALDVDNPEILVRQGPQGFSLCTPGGERIAGIDPGQRDLLLATLRHQAWAKGMRAQRNPRQTFAVRVDTAGSRQSGFAVEGEQVVFVVGSDRPVYPALIDIDPAGRIAVLYPKDDSEIALLAPGEPRRLPPAGTDPILVRPAFGMDDVILLGFSERTPLLERLAGADAEPSQPGYQAFRDLLQGALMPDDPGIARAVLRFQTQARQSGDPGCH